MEVLQRCPRCKESLSKEEYPLKSWGDVGQSCRSCVRVRMLKRRDGIILNKQAILDMLIRQHFRCLGCQYPITTSACVDHDHKTKRIRGLLCRPCNLALGNAKDDAATLRRLTAYLDYDRTKIGVYLIGALKNPSVGEVA